MRGTLREIDFLTSQATTLNGLFRSINSRREEKIGEFRRQVVTTLYQDVEGFEAAFSDAEGLDYLRSLFKLGILDPVPAHLPSLVRISLTVPCFIGC